MIHKTSNTERGGDSKIRGLAMLDQNQNLLCDARGGPLEYQNQPRKMASHGRRIRNESRSTKKRRLIQTPCTSNVAVSHDVGRNEQRHDDHAKGIRQTSVKGVKETRLVNR
jgi:hypothetical protein